MEPRGLRIAWVVVFSLGAAPEALAHPGGLNRDGCHTSRKSGGYHCHRSGSRPSVKALPSFKLPKPKTWRELVYAFRADNPCPSTGRRGAGACPGWEVGYAEPIECGGEKVIENLKWIDVDERRRRHTLGCTSVEHEAR